MDGWMDVWMNLKLDFSIGWMDGMDGWMDPSLLVQLVGFVVEFWPSDSKRREGRGMHYCYVMSITTT